MGKLAEKIINLLLKGKSDDLLKRIQADPKLAKATKEVDIAIKNLHKSLEEWEANRKKNGY